MAKKKATTRRSGLREQTLSKAATVPDSEGSDELLTSELGDDDSAKALTPRSGSALMQEVRISTRAQSSVNGFGTVSTRGSTLEPSDLSLDNANTHDYSGTSMAVTPAESSTTSDSFATGSRRTRKPRVNAALRAQRLRPNKTRPKRKRAAIISDSEGNFDESQTDDSDFKLSDVEIDEDETDEKIARKLQAEEYRSEPPSKKQRSQASSTHRRGIVPPTPSHAPAIPQEPKTTSDPAGLWDDSLSDYDTDVFDPYSDFPRGHQSGLLGSHRVFDPITDEVARKYYERYGSRAWRERKKLIVAHPEVSTLWDDLRRLEPIKPIPATQPADISRKLKPFQLEGLNWMVRQEQTQWKGGLLGDEMGMGKTIQAVSLIMSDYPAKSPTLVLVPPVALMQWQSEIAEYTGGKLKVLVYHNSNSKVKHLKRKDLLKYDVIMISYSGLESMYRKQNKGWVRGEDVVKEDSVIHSIHYHRLILDEAHSIKSRTTGVAKACFALKSDFKWCLSGTPVQNRIGEFFSLLRFLEVQPVACYFCKMCSCKELHWSQDASKRCNVCHHSGFNHVSIFIQEILNPITQDDSDIRKEGMDKLRLLTDRIMLRRLKRNHTASMELPPKHVIIHNEFFGEIERDFSSSIMANTNRKFDTYVAQGVVLNNYANIFGLIMQMRQVANHPDLILKKRAEGGQNVLICCICDEPAEEPIRSACRHEFCRECASHYFHVGGDQKDVADCPRCHIPLEIDLQQPAIEQEEDSVKKNSIINRIKMENWTSSTKIEMLVYDLYKLRSKKQTHKSIVFSQFTSMLQLVEWRLRRAGFSTVMLDGSMTPAQRQKSIEYFMNNVDVEVFLVSLKAGGVALNLTEASRVFLIDPWWNPAAEWQSADRCHRIGQRRPCVITRLCIEDSVESRIVLLQEKKANMINGTINNDQIAMDKLTPEDMQFLFRGA